MAHATESASIWDILRVCGITHPSYHHTCIGTGKNGYSCNNQVPRKFRRNALHELEILSCSPNNSLAPKLQYAAALLCCKRRHQDQAEAISQTWYRRLMLSGTRSGTNFPQSSLSQFYRDQPNATMLPHGADRVQVVVPGSSRSPFSPCLTSVVHEVTPAMIRENRLSFHVSTSRLASVAVSQLDNGRVHAVTLRTFRKGRQISDVDCSICLGRDSDDTVYLNCTECAGEFHWVCMESWIRGGLQLSNVTCPCCREERYFDGFYCTPCTPAAETSDTPTERMAHHQPLAQRPEHIVPAQQSSALRQQNSLRVVRRSGRTTRRPDFFTPNET
ncbi:hypothetical protein KXV23_000370 [Aspergillus fumigatus]|nr:hypothetical protein KXV23_000370 [Aspergillus fumigatus]